jgi:hypothetical protein
MEPDSMLPDLLQLAAVMPLERWLAFVGAAIVLSAIPRPAIATALWRRAPA